MIAENVVGAFGLHPRLLVWLESESAYSLGVANMEGERGDLSLSLQAGLPASWARDGERCRDLVATASSRPPPSMRSVLAPPLARSLREGDGAS